MISLPISNTETFDLFLVPHFNEFKQVVYVDIFQRYTSGDFDYSPFLVNGYLLVTKFNQIISNLYESQNVRFAMTIKPLSISDVEYVEKTGLPVCTRLYRDNNYCIDMFDGSRFDWQQFLTTGSSDKFIIHNRNNDDDRFYFLLPNIAVTKDSSSIYLLDSNEIYDVDLDDFFNTTLVALVPNDLLVTDSMIIDLVNKKAYSFWDTQCLIPVKDQFYYLDSQNNVLYKTIFKDETVNLVASYELKPNDIMIIKDGELLIFDSINSTLTKDIPFSEYDDQIDPDDSTDLTVSDKDPSLYEFKKIGTFTKVDIGEVLSIEKDQFFADIFAKEVPQGIITIPVQISDTSSIQSDRIIVTPDAPTEDFPEANALLRTNLPFAGIAKKLYDKQNNKVVYEFTGLDSVNPNTVVYNYVFGKTGDYYYIYSKKRDYEVEYPLPILQLNDISLRPFFVSVSSEDLSTVYVFYDFKDRLETLKTYVKSDSLYFDVTSFAIDDNFLKIDLKKTITLEPSVTCTVKLKTGVNFSKLSTKLISIPSPNFYTATEIKTDDQVSTTYDSSTGKFVGTMYCESVDNKAFYNAYIMNINDFYIGNNRYAYNDLYATQDGKWFVNKKLALYSIYKDSVSFENDLLKISISIQKPDTLPPLSVNCFYFSSSTVNGSTFDSKGYVCDFNNNNRFESTVAIRFDDPNYIYLLPPKGEFDQATSQVYTKVDYDNNIISIHRIDDDSIIAQYTDIGAQKLATDNEYFIQKSGSSIIINNFILNDTKKFTIDTSQFSTTCDMRTYSTDTMLGCTLCVMNGTFGTNAVLNYHMIYDKVNPKLYVIALPEKEYSKFSTAKLVTLNNTTYIHSTYYSVNLLVDPQSKSLAYIDVLNFNANSQSYNFIGNPELIETNSYYWLVFIAANKDNSSTYPSSFSEFYVVKLDKSFAIVDTIKVSFNSHSYNSGQRIYIIPQLTNDDQICICDEYSSYFMIISPDTLKSQSDPLGYATYIDDASIDINIVTDENQVSTYLKNELSRINSDTDSVIQKIKDSIQILNV